MAFATQYLIDKNFDDLNPVLYGWGSCDPGEHYVLSRRNFILMHYVRHGKGTFCTSDREYALHAGQVFTLHFAETGTMTADPDDPWELSWIGVEGKLSDGINSLPSVFDVPEGLLDSLRHPKSESDSLPYELASELFMLHARMATKKEKKRDYALIVKERVQSSFREKISVEQIANELGLDKRYLVRVFKKRTGYTIQDYILRTRLQASKQYLQKGYSVQEAAKLSGFNDVYNFSRLFTREEGENPSSFKKNVMLMKKEAEEKLK